ncbi:helix-turn-helix domain-containing protein [Microbacterium kribbense]|uniref:Helix-turn-helix domain-containing protein n=2 Tax=Microbacterium kribbense TaxID=433645 RepID=A0ABP7GKG3_9MICO
MVLQMIEAQAAPISAAALTHATGLHENTVRGHLEQLLADGYIVREREESSGRGRPAWLWRAVAQDPESPYAALAGVLAETLARTGADPARQAREAGRSWGRELAARRTRTAAGPREAVIDAMREQGFAPEDTGDDVLLRRCPLMEAASRHPTIICAVHQGIIDGVLQAQGQRADSVLEPFSAPGVCTLHLAVAP